jgi:hypothetical protein
VLIANHIRYLVAAMAAVCLLAIPVAGSSAKPISTAHAAAKKGASCEHPWIIKGRGDKLRKGQKLKGTGYHGNVYERANSGRPSTMMPAVWVDHGYVACWYSFHNVTGFSGSWYRAGRKDFSFEVEHVSSSSYHFAIARDRKHRGRNCGDDAFRRIYDRGYHVRKGDKAIQLEYTKTADKGADIKWSTSPTVCTVRLYNGEGKAMTPPNPQSGFMHVDYDTANTLSYIEIRARR